MPVNPVLLAYLGKEITMAPDRENKSKDKPKDIVIGEEPANITEMAKLINDGFSSMKEGH